MIWCSWTHGSASGHQKMCHEQSCDCNGRSTWPTNIPHYPWHHQHQTPWESMRHKRVLCFSSGAFWCLFRRPHWVIMAYSTSSNRFNGSKLPKFQSWDLWSFLVQPCGLQPKTAPSTSQNLGEMPRLSVGQTQSSCHWSLHAIVARTTFTASTSTTSVAFADGLNCWKPNETTAFPCHGWSSRDVLTFARMSPSAFSAASCGQAKSSLRKKDACHQWLWTMVNPLQYQCKNKMLRRFQHLRIQRHLVKLRHPGKGAKETQSSATFEMKSTCLVSNHFNSQHSHTAHQTKNPKTI